MCLLSATSALEEMSRLLVSPPLHQNKNKHTGRPSSNNARRYLDKADIGELARELLEGRSFAVHSKKHTRTQTRTDVFKASDEEFGKRKHNQTKVTITHMEYESKTLRHSKTEL